MLVTVAFNRPDLIRAQEQLISRHLLDPYLLVVVDNSPDRSARSEIRSYCRRQGIPYVSLPYNFYTGRDASRSHGEALNWMWHNVLRKQRSKYVGFLDHDVLPMRSTSVLRRIEPIGMWGRQRDGAGCWYLWPGFCFFRTDHLQEINVDFNPLPARGDTGSGNYASLYSMTQRSGIAPLGEQSISIGANENFELLEDWIHIVNASGWRPERASGKEDAVWQMIAKAEHPTEGWMDPPVS